MKWTVWQLSLMSVVVVGLAILFSLNQATPGFADPDVYYHMRMAQEIAQHGVMVDFPWLPYTTLAQHFTDQHFALHVLLIPFVTLVQPILGTKIWIVLAALGTVLMLALCLRELQLRWWWAATVLLALSTPWTFRLQLVKATPLAIILLLWALVCLVQKRSVILFCISWLYVWVHGGFILLAVLAGCWVLSQLPFTPWRQWIKLMLPVFIVLGGSATGVVLNPYFPNNIYFYWDQLVQIGIINYQATIGVGAEWYPYNPAQLWFGLSGLMAAVLSGVVYAIVRRQRLTPLHLVSLGLTLGSLALTLKSRRYIEYLGPTLALSVAVWWDQVRVSWVQLEHWLLERSLSQHVRRAALGCGLIIAFMPVLLYDLSINHKDVTNGDDPAPLAAPMQWLDQHAVPGDKVLHSDWDDFPLLFYYSDQLEYMAGLDPTFMYRANADRYWLWQKVTTGTFHGDVDSALTTLAVRYILITKDHQAMYRLITQSQVVRKVYSDAAADIFVVTQPSHE